MLTFFAYAIMVLVLISSLATPASSPWPCFFYGDWSLYGCFPHGKLSILYMEVILVISVIISSVLASLIGLVCVRYIKIYFAMLTLAFWDALLFFPLEVLLSDWRR